ncbi:MAG: hypothetical protein IPM16_12200 [Chloroflexi bacterium]|nr:hypothetical protein [Chloroflexota bacterium]
MSTLEREIIEKFHQLHPDAKRRVRALIEQELLSTLSRLICPHSTLMRGGQTSMRYKPTFGRGSARPELLARFRCSMNCARSLLSDIVLDSGSFIASVFPETLSTSAAAYQVPAGREHDAP